MSTNRVAVRLTHSADVLRPRFAELVAEAETIVTEVREAIAKLREIGPTVANLDVDRLRQFAETVRSDGNADHERAAEIAESVLAIDRRHRELEAQHSRWRNKAVALIEASFESDEPLKRFQLGLPSVWPLPRIEEIEQDLRLYAHELDKLAAIHDQLDLYPGAEHRGTATAESSGSMRKAWPAVIQEAFFERIGGIVGAGVLFVLAVFIAWALTALGVDLGPITDLIESVREFVSG